MKKQTIIEVETSEEKISDFEFFMKNQRFFNFSQIEKFTGLPEGTLTKFNQGRKPNKDHINKLNVFRQYLLNEIKK